WKKARLVFQTAGEPPSLGSSIWAIIGSTRNTRAALENTATANMPCASPNDAGFVATASLMLRLASPLSERRKRDHEKHEKARRALAASPRAPLIPSCHPGRPKADPGPRTAPRRKLGPGSPRCALRPG